MRSRDETKQEVLRATDIVSLVEQHVPLTRTGRNHKALCPFHQEKTPSFTVSADRQTFKCFGCGKGGNAIDFLMEKERIDFKTALHALADRAGIQIAGRGAGDGGAGAVRQEAFKIQELAAEFFRRCFLEMKDAEHARAYVSGRGIDEESSDRFGLGYAPDRFDGLLKFLQNRGFAPQQGERAGVLRQKKTGSGWYDRFRNRLMFPIHDVMGRVIGFGGRAFSDEDHPKYLNSDETPIFKKREVLYGLPFAKEAARQRGEVAVVEGYTDAILAHQAGFPWVVATLGTAFGMDHAAQLKRVASKLLVFFDGDAAGITANRRGLVEAAKFALEKFRVLRVALLPDGLDPADLIVQRGPAALAEAVEKAVDLVEYLEGAAGAAPAERALALKDICEILAGLEEDTFREMQIASAAHRFRVPEDVIRGKVKDAQKAAMKAFSNSRAQTTDQRAVALTRNCSAQPSNPSGAQAPARDAGRAEAAPLGRLDRWFLTCLIAAPALVEDARQRGISPELCEDSRARAIADAIFAGRGIAELEDEAAKLLGAELAAGLDSGKSYEREWPDVADLLLESQIESSCTKSGSDELKDSVARKLRQFELQKRRSSKSGDGAGASEASAGR